MHVLTMHQQGAMRTGQDAVDASMDKAEDLKNAVVGPQLQSSLEWKPRRHAHAWGCALLWVWDVIVACSLPTLRHC